jgi:predicted ferric reductase
MRYLSGLILLSLLAWGSSLPARCLVTGFFFWRGQGIQLTACSAVALSALLLMATRPRWLEQRLGGLDHLYLLHKWSGIGTGLLVLLHWLL